MDTPRRGVLQVFFLSPSPENGKTTPPLALVDLLRLVALPRRLNGVRHAQHARRPATVRQDTRDGRRPSGPTP